MFVAITLPSLTVECVNPWLVTIAWTTPRVTKVTRRAAITMDPFVTFLAQTVTTGRITLQAQRSMAVAIAWLQGRKSTNEYILPIIYAYYIVYYCTVELGKNVIWAFKHFQLSLDKIIFFWQLTNILLYNFRRH